MKSPIDIQGAPDPAVVVDPFGLCGTRKQESETEFERLVRNIEYLQEFLDRELKFYRARVATAEADMARYKARLKEVCTHENAERKSRHFRGSYYDKAQTTTWYVCPVCEWKSEEKTETHSWYG